MGLSRENFSYAAINVGTAHVTVYITRRRAVFVLHAMLSAIGGAGGKLYGYAYNHRTRGIVTKLLFYFM